MLPLIKQTYESQKFKDHMTRSWFKHFILPESKSNVKYSSSIRLPELCDLGWVYISIANVFEDKLSTAERITLGYLLSLRSEELLKIKMIDRDRRQLLNALLCLRQYKEGGDSNILLPLDMATSALILKSAMYRCVTTMSMVGLTTTKTTIAEQLREPVSDSYTRLYEAALNKLPPSQRAKISTSLSRDELKKKVIMPDYYGSSAAIHRIPEELHEPYLEAKEELIPGHMRHLEWGRAAGEILTERGITSPQWKCSLTGRNIGYTCTEQIHADVQLPDGSSFEVSKTVEGEPYHLPLIANTVHSPDSSILVAWYQYAAVHNITTFTTHDAVSATANNLNQMRQIIAEQIALCAIYSPVMAMAKQLDLPLPEIGDMATWADNFKPHNFMS